MVRECKVCIGVASFDSGTESSIWMGVRIRDVPVMCCRPSTDDTIKVVECGGSQVSIADHGKIFIIDARVAGYGVVDDGNHGGMYLSDANVGADVAAWAPFAMWSAVGEIGLKPVDGATKDVVVLGAKGVGLKGNILKGMPSGCRFDGGWLC